MKCDPDDTKKLVLHIGTHKTGTTSVQAFLSSNRDALLAQGWDYPLFGRLPGMPQSHRHVAAWFRKLPAEYPPGTGEAIERGISKAPRCLLSSEDFYFIHGDGHIAAIADAFGQRALVICVLRDPVSHLLSMYKESIKGPQTQTFEAFLKRYHAAMLKGSGFSYYSYEANINRWRKHHDVITLRYRKEGLIGQVLDAAGLRLAGHSSADVPRENEAFSDAVTVLKLALNRFFASEPSSAEYRRLWRRLLDLSWDKLLPDASAFCEIRSLDMTGFIETFAHCSPEYADPAAVSQTEISVPVMTMSDADAVEILRGLTPAKTSAKN